MCRQCSRTPIGDSSHVLRLRPVRKVDERESRASGAGVCLHGGESGLGGDAGTWSVGVQTAAGVVVPGFARRGRRVADCVGSRLSAVLLTVV